MAGGAQTARVSDTLADPVRVLVTDEAGNPLRDVPVHATVTRGEGDILLPDQLTRQDGTALFRWVLGPITGPQTMEARVENLEPAVVRATATGCDLPECPQYTIAEGTLQEMDLSTYDLSSEVVHPDVLARAGQFGSPWYWMAITPYPDGNPFYENPSIYRSINGRYWRRPTR